jgi:hypothetical protein
MRRAQNILLGLWVAALIVLALFNWSLLSRPEPVVFLFAEFESAWGLWLLGLALLFPVLMRLIAWADSRWTERRAQTELQRLKAKAFDERGAELEQLARSIQERVETSVRSVLGGSPASRPDAGP